MNESFLARSTDWQEQTRLPLSEEVASINADLKLEKQYLIDSIETYWIDKAHLSQLMYLLAEQLDHGFDFCFDLTAIDERLRQQKLAPQVKDFTVVYHLRSYVRNRDVRIKVALTTKDKALDSVSNIWPSANWYEREVWDMFGIHFNNHPHLVRILMPLTWIGHPLLKDHPARATEMDPFTLPDEQQDIEQEALKFNPDDWGMKRNSKTSDFTFLNLGPNHPSVHGAFRIVLHGARFIGRCGLWVIGFVLSRRHII